MRIRSLSCRFVSAAAFALAAGTSCPAHAGIVTETLPLASAPLGTFSTLTLGNFQLTWVGVGDHETVGMAGGVKALQDAVQRNFLGAEVTLSLVDPSIAVGGVFTLVSADIAGFAGDNGIAINIGASSYPSGIPNSYETVDPAGTTDVSSVDLNIIDYSSDYAVTNLVVSYDAVAATPEPTTLALLGAGLAGIGIARRRRR